MKKVRRPKSCEICDGIFRRNKKKEVVHTLRSKNLRRCIGCQFIEDRVKEICFICGNEMYNNLSLFIQNGNTCRRCLDNVNEALVIRQKEEAEKAKAIRYQKWLIINNLFMCEDSQKLFDFEEQTKKEALKIKQQEGRSKNKKKRLDKKNKKVV